MEQNENKDFTIEAIKKYFDEQTKSVENVMTSNVYSPHDLMFLEILSRRNSVLALTHALHYGYKKGVENNENNRNRQKGNRKKYEHSKNRN